MTRMLNVRQSTTAYAPVHYDSDSSPINNLTVVLTGTGTNGQLWQPDTVDDKRYGTYNYCNMPHVRAKEYQVPKGFKLKYVEVIHRHHKRTPYGSNTFPKEAISWDCSDALTNHGSSATSVPVTPVAWNAFVDQANPMTTTTNPGFVGSNCQFPQITSGGAQDSFTHGKDLADVYQKKLRFIPNKYDDKLVSFRVTNNVITSQVASALIPAMFHEFTRGNDGRGIAAKIQSSSYDSLEPTYSCKAADNARSANEGSNPNWQASLSQTKDLYARLDSVSGVSPGDGGWHANIDHYFDNLSSKRCHSKPLPCSITSPDQCVSEADADTVFRLGQWMYAYRFRSSAQATTYATLRHSAFMLELKSHLDSKMAGQDQMLYRHNVAHDGSMSALLGLLQIEEMVWPGMGAEIVFELYQQTMASKKPGQSGNKGDWFLRVLWGGRPLKTATPLGTLDMISVKAFYDGKAIGAAGALALGGALLYSRRDDKPRRPVDSFGMNHAGATTALPKGSKSASNQDAMPAQSVVNEGRSSAEDARGVADKLKGASSSAKQKFEEGVGKTREGVNAVGGKSSTAARG
ncbi:hypothetical protein OIO90_004726 [Microbotryomycetes sp. JL221]|nr:hypothetical protein OIO90_004726 [Microbotryomycetes sp. JL221]